VGKGLYTILPYKRDFFKRSAGKGIGPAGMSVITDLKPSIVQVVKHPLKKGQVRHQEERIQVDQAPKAVVDECESIVKDVVKWAKMEVKDYPDYPITEEEFFFAL